MNRFIRKRYEMLLRVQGFGAAHRPLFPEKSAGAKAFADIDEAVARIEALADAQAAAATLGQRERMEAREIVTAAIRDIAATARQLDRVPGTRNMLGLPRGRSDVAILRAARSFVREADRVKDQLAVLGLPLTCADDLSRAADVFEETLRQRRTGRRDVAASAAAMNAALSDASRALARLDVVVPHAVKRDPAILAGWKRDRTIVGGRSDAKSGSGEAAASSEAARQAEPTPAEPLAGGGLPKAS